MELIKNCKHKRFLVIEIFNKFHVYSVLKCSVLHTTLSITKKNSIFQQNVLCRAQHYLTKIHCMESVINRSKDHNTKYYMEFIKNFKHKRFLVIEIFNKFHVYSVLKCSVLHTTLSITKKNSIFQQNVLCRAQNYLTKIHCLKSVINRSKIIILNKHGIN